MAVNVLLSVGDGNVTDDFDIGQYIVEQGINAPPPEMDARTRVVELTLDISAASADALWAAWSNIETKLSQARKARGAYGIGTGVTLSVQLSTTNWVYFDILDGALALENLGVTLLNNYAVLSLVCLPFARGDAVTVATSAELTNGSGAVMAVTNIPGDVPALLRVTASDTSDNGAVMQRLRFVTRAMHEMTPGTDVSLIVDLAASGSGVETTEANTIGGEYNDLSPSADWQTVGHADKPAAQYSLGLMDVYARVRDGYSGLTQPASLTATAKTEGISQRQTRSVNVTNVATAGITFASPAKAGSVITIQLGIKSRTAAPATPAGFTAGPAQVHGTFGASSYIFYKVATGGEQAITLTWTGNNDAHLRSVNEWYGLALATPADVSAGGTTTSNTSQVSGTTAATAQANALSLTMHTIVSGIAISRDSGWSTSSSGSAAAGFAAAHRVETATGTKSHTATTPTNQTGAGVILVLKGRETAAENLAAATYQYRIVPFDALANLGSTSDVVSVAIASNGAAVLQWTPGGGAVTGYRIYWNRGAGWKYLTLASPLSYYVHYTETSAVTGDPPEASSVPGQWRALVSLASGTTLFAGPAASSTIGDLAWHLVYLGTFPLPPLPALDGGTLQDWRVTLQGKRVDGTTNAMGADALYLFPHDEAQFVATVTGLALATSRDFLIETRRDGRTFGMLRATGTTTDAGHLDVAGQAMIGPGDAAVMVHADRQSGVSDVVDSKLTLALRYIPRWRMLRGT